MMIKSSIDKLANDRCDYLLDCLWSESKNNEMWSDSMNKEIWSMKMNNEK